MQSTARDQDWPSFLRLMSAFIEQHATRARPALVPELELYLATDVTPLWRATEKLLKRENIPPPFWCFAWPGGQVLARLVLDQPTLVAGKRVFDFASGSGLVALACKKAGALTVTANDIDPMAIVAMGLNAHINHLDIQVLHQDMVGKTLTDFDVILAGDCCYEWPMAGYAIEWMRRLAGEGKDVLFADPGRPHAPKTGIEEIARYDVPTSKEVEDSDVKSTGVFRLLPEE